MADKKIVRYKLVKHKWPDEIKAERDRRIKIVSIILLCVIFFFGGFLVNNLLDTRAITSDDSFSKLTEIYTVMKNKFYFGKDQKDLDKKLINGAIDGMVNAGGDSHTMYMTPQLTQDFTSSMEGSYEGIGVQYYALDADTYMIEKVFQDSPAEEAGLMPGDRIYAIEGTICKNMDTDKVRSLITGKVGTKVELEIVRENQHIIKTVERRKVLSSVFSEVKDNTGILELSTFAETSGEEVGNHLSNLKKKGCKNLVLDMRDNGGGYLVAAQEIASYLLPEDTVIFKEESKDGKTADYKTLDGFHQYTFDKITILVNGDTASAAEVLTAALQEHLQAQVVGVKTYGKGTVQVPLTYKDGSMFKYTTAEWITPKGQKINGIGITPDVIVELDPALTVMAPKLDKKELYEGNTVNIAAQSTQTLLKFLDYPVDRTDAFFSPASSEALRQYQGDKGLEVTGNINADVISSLLSSCALKWHSNEAVYDTQMQKAMEISDGE